MRTMAQIAAEDRKIMKNIFRSYQVITDATKTARRKERAADNFRLEGQIENQIKNTGTCRECVSKRGI